MTSITGFGNIAASLSKLKETLTDAQTDTNTPVTLTEAQFEAAAKTDPNLTGGTTAAAAFQKLDANHDGQLGVDELTAGINLNTQVQSVLLQSQELTSGSAFLALLGGSSSSSSSSMFSSGADNFAGLTSSLLGGGSDSANLASLLSGGNANTSTLAGLFGGGDTSSTDTYTALLQQLIASYTPPATDTGSTTPPATTTPVDKTA